ncbi:MAG TPA: type II secretion system minor pseudopilin GspI [Steroidobacteraceae bacterium]|nr:type II secretion system minor pseudopilin GspI [Steroidobacteraceae bacterium]
MSTQRGFTLIEVLAALVIVALGMLAAIQAVNQTARNGTYLREKTLAHWIGMNVVTERRLQASPPDVAESTGQVDFAGAKWQWTMKVTQTEVESMRRMDVSVRLASADEKSSLATVSGFYGAAIGAAGGQNLSWVGNGAPGTGGQAGGQNDEEEEPPGPVRDDSKRPSRPSEPPPEDEE